MSDVIGNSYATVLATTVAFMFMAVSVPFSQMHYVRKDIIFKFDMIVHLTWTQDDLISLLRPIKHVFTTQERINYDKGFP